MNEKKFLKSFLLLACTLLCLSLTLIFTDNFLAFSAKVALASAKTFLPESGLSINLTKESEEAKSKETTTNNDTTQKTTQAETEESTAAVGTSADNTVFTETPEDILEIIKQAEAAAENDKKDAAISEYKFTTDGVTDSFEKVRVKNVNNTSIDIEALLKESLNLAVTQTEPSVLIFHTHTTETYQILDRNFYAVGFLSRTNDKGKNMVRVGQAIAEEIEAAGFTVIHDTEIHDATYNGAYDDSRAAVEKYLKKYPSLKIVLDIHRDAIQRSDGTKVKPTAQINEKKAAQIMIISGCQEEGNSVEGFPNWKKNLVFAVQLQNKLEELFEGITRPLYFCPRKYNMDLTECSLLIEIGSDGNTLEEAVYTGKCLGVAVSKILEEYEE